MGKGVAGIKVVASCSYCFWLPQKIMDSLELKSVTSFTGVAVRSVPQFCLFCLLNCVSREDGP